MQIKEQIVCYGSCQTLHLSKDLLQVPEFQERYDIVYISKDEKDTRYLPDCSAGAILLEEMGNWRTPSQSSPPGTFARVLSFPSLAFKSLWPLHITDPANKPLPGLPFGLFPYGDTFVLHLAAQGKSSDEIMQRYFELDLVRSVNLERMYELEIERLKALDARCGTTVTQFILSRFRKERLFHTILHPTRPLMNELLKQVASKLALGAAIDEQRLAALPDRMSGLQVPIHPTVARWFGLTWVTDDIRYTHHRFGELSCREMMERYVTFAVEQHTGKTVNLRESIKLSASFSD